MTITANSQAILYLCSHLGLSPEADLAPLTRREWNPLARKIQASPIGRPQNLLGLGVTELQKQLELDELEARRLANLLQRREALSNELERLANLGIHALTRADREYPQRYRERLQESAPVVLFYAGEPALLGQPGIAVVGSRHLDPAGQESATFIGNACGLSGLVLYSGGAKGVDTLSMNAALEARHGGRHPGSQPGEDHPRSRAAPGLVPWRFMPGVALCTQRGVFGRRGYGP